MESQLATTIKVNDLTLADWVAIAEHVGNSKLWGWNKWVESPAASNLVKEWTLNDWEKASQVLGVGMGWAVNRCKELSQVAV